MSKRAYIPDRGDIIRLNLGGTAGREFDGPHFALVISNIEFQRRTGLCIILPTTSKERSELGELTSKLPTIENLKRDGWVLLHHVRSIDFRERAASFAGRLTLGDKDHREFIDDLVDRLFSIVE